MSKKILIFGNGISLRYNKEEYNYESLVKKFNEGIKTSVALNLRDQNYYLNNEVFKDLYKTLKENTSNFNEGFFFKIFKMLFSSIFISNVKHNKRLDLFKDYNDVWDRCYDAIKHNSDEPLIGHLKLLFYSSYSSIIYSIQRAVSINIGNKEWIYIDYSSMFLNNLNSYDLIYTTNYYVGHLNKHHKNINYLHGKVLRISDNSLVSNFFRREQTIGGEFDDVGFDSKILFGENYEDKVFLNSVMNWVRILKRVLPTQNFDFSNYEVDIVGLSTEGDKDLIQEIIKQANNVNIYYHTPKDKKEWEDIIFRKENCNLFPDSDYPGFIGEKEI